MKRKRVWGQKPIEPKTDWSAEKIRWWLRMYYIGEAYSFKCVCGHLMISHDVYVKEERPVNIDGRECLKKTCICPRISTTNLAYIEALYEAKSDKPTERT